MATLFQPTKMKSWINEEIYPPAIRCCISYDKPKEQLTETRLWTISFPGVCASFSYQILAGLYCTVCTTITCNISSHVLKTGVMRVSCFVLIHTWMQMFPFLLCQMYTTQHQVKGKVSVVCFVPLLVLYSGLQDSFHELSIGSQLTSEP